jgi:hypothetical protein
MQLARAQRCAYARQPIDNALECFLKAYPVWYFPKATGSNEKQLRSRKALKSGPKVSAGLLMARPVVRGRRRKGNTGAVKVECSGIGTQATVAIHVQCKVDTLIR